MKRILNEWIYIFTNYFVCYIPFWPIRKLLYRALGVKIGKHSRILMKTVIELPWRVSIGDNTIINERCLIDGRGGVTIGSNTTIATCSRLITGYHDIDSDDFAYKQAPIIVGDNVAIFTNCTVLSGAEIPDGCVFSANSFIRKGDYVANGIYGGNPVRFIRVRKISDKYKPGKLMSWFR